MLFHIGEVRRKQADFTLIRADILEEEAKEFIVGAFIELGLAKADGVAAGQIVQTERIFEADFAAFDSRRREVTDVLQAHGVGGRI